VPGLLLAQMARIRGSGRPLASPWMASKLVRDIRPNRSPFAYVSDKLDFVWGVIDIVPSEKTDFPDTRNKSAIHSANGSCMVIPREGDKIRVYIQLSDTDAVDPETGRVDLGRYGPERLLEVAKKTFRPYTLDAEPDKIEWWTIYQSGFQLCCLTPCTSHRPPVGQRVASRFTANERVFIAGDACHTHSPKAGQGMNASMNDTHNLGSYRGYSPCPLHNADRTFLLFRSMEIGVCSPRLGRYFTSQDGVSPTSQLIHSLRDQRT